MTAKACILITGATGAIGGALAEAYAGPGVTLILQGRKAGRLAGLAQACAARGAHVLTKVIDVRDRQALVGWLGQVCGQHVPDLVIACAGMNSNIGPDGEGEQWDDVQALVEVNILAVMSTVDAVLPAMRRRGSGQIALVSSLAAWFGLPVTPSYCASKAAIKTYGEALRGWLGPEGIRVSIVMPGYVNSDMCGAMPGPKPFLWKPERAALAIRRGLKMNRARIAFPFPLNLSTMCLAMLPPGISIRIVRWLGYGR